MCVREIETILTLKPRYGWEGVTKKKKKDMDGREDVIIRIINKSMDMVEPGRGNQI